jgi:hypothetical protein
MKRGGILDLFWGRKILMIIFQYLGENCVSVIKKQKKQRKASDVVSSFSFSFSFSSFSSSSSSSSSCLVSDFSPSPTSHSYFYSVNLERVVLLL